jgi:iron complex outermembrane receptor protein
LQANEKLARQAAGDLPGAVQQKAAIYNRTIFGAVHHEIELSDLFTVKTFVTGNSTAFTNPFITNYEERLEQNLGAGSNLLFHTKKNGNSFQWMNGIEWLYDHSTIDDYGNRSGVKDTVQFKDNIYAGQWFVFSQMQYIVGDTWNFTAGLSVNSQSYRYRRLTDVNSNYATRSINATVTPRLAVLYRVNHDISLYALAAKGFSPPALAEVRPSDGNFYGDLAAESGWNYEAGVKGELFSRRLQFDLAGYFFKLQNAIVRRNNSSGAEYFVNAGGTEQKGIEASVKYQLIKKQGPIFSGWNIWTSYSFQPYRFTDYKQLASNYSGNELTGVPRNIWVSGMDIETVKGIYLNVSINAVSALPLTDANDAYADAYQLVQLKIGYRSRQKNKGMDIFAGVDNLWNQDYSLGNDINAAGKRYYNPAAGRNVFVGMIFHF